MYVYTYTNIQTYIYIHTHSLAKQYQQYFGHNERFSLFSLCLVIDASSMLLLEWKQPHWMFIYLITPPNKHTRARTRFFLNPVTKVHIIWSGIPSASLHFINKSIPYILQRGISGNPESHPMLGSCLCQFEKRLRWERLWTPSCSLQLLGPWIQEPIHSRRRREGTHWQNEFTFVQQYKANSSFKKLHFWENYIYRCIEVLLPQKPYRCCTITSWITHHLASELQELG